jgi:hypothetical protein
MTKKELFEILANCPDDAEIYIQEELVLPEEEEIWVYNVREPSPEVRMVKDCKVAARPCKETAGAKKSVIL